MGGIPEGFHTLTTSICVANGDKAIAHYAKALGAKEDYRMLVPGTSKIMHACLQVGSSKLFLSDEFGPVKAPKGGRGGSSFYVYVEDVDAAHRRAVQAGMKPMMPPTEMFWGDRMSHLVDPFGHSWNLATHVRMPSPAEMEAGMKAQFGNMGKPKRKPTARKKAPAKKAATKKRR